MKDSSNPARALRRAIAAATLLSAAAAVAAPPAVPYGPRLNEQQNVSLASLASYAELVRSLHGIAATSGGAVAVGAAPWPSNTGRTVPYAVVGHGRTAVLVVSQQHGNEMEASGSAVAVVRALAGGSALAKALRDKLTVVVVPRANVDGFDGEAADGTPLADALGNVVPWRQNWDPRHTAPPLPAFYERARGYDINRYHPFRPGCPLDNPNLGGVASCEAVDTDNPALGNPVPEAKNIRWLFDLYHPVVVLDLHHQGSYVDAAGRMITASTMWPTAQATADALQAIDADTRARFDRGVAMAKRAISLIAGHLARFGYANLTQYPGTTPPGISRNAYGLLGSGSVLLELRGGIGQKSSGYIGRIGFEAVLAVLEGLADDPALAGVDPAVAEALPERGPALPGEEH